jgi:hypothetical protein
VLLFRKESWHEHSKGADDPMHCARRQRVVNLPRENLDLRHIEEHLQHCRSHNSAHMGTTCRLKLPCARARPQGSERPQVRWSPGSHAALLDATGMQASSVCSSQRLCWDLSGSAGHPCHRCGGTCNMHCYSNCLMLCACKRMPHCRLSKGHPLMPPMHAFLWELQS